MGKGLGYLQRAILDTLEDARNSKVWYLGFDTFRLEPEPGCVIAYGYRVRLVDDVYDLRASMEYLSRKLDKGRRNSFASPSFQASFSRAVRSLVERGLLISLISVPVAQVHKRPADDYYLSYGLDGKLYLRASGKQVRFVRLP